MNEPNREKEIFEQALDIDSPKERADFIEKACAGDASLANRIKALIDADQMATNFLSGESERTPMESHLTPLSEGPGTKIDRYKLLQQIGEGGFGVVYMAEQIEPVKRRVALKIIKLGMDTKQVVARFEAERQALALMDHPNIAKALDGGATETGRPYFVMELVKGTPITSYCDEQNLSTAERLELFIKVCAAVQHAHQKGIIHRDLKPSNILVTLHDGEPVPKVIDFGIAKATQQELTEKTLFTEFHQFIGTPAYMSPEQAERSGLDIDTRSDIYSLGVLLYQLLTGKTPFEAKELLSAGFEEMRRIIREQEPVKPSTRVSTLDNLELIEVARLRKSDTGKLLGSIRGDLDWVVMKCLEKDRNRRYETANGLAADVKRHLNDDPVSAVAPTLRYQISKFYLRNRRFARVAGAFGVLLIASTVFSSWLAVRATRAEQEQSLLRVEAERNRVEAEKQRNEAEVARKVAADQAVRLSARIYRDQIDRAQNAIARGDINIALAELKECEPALRDWEWRYVNSMIPLSAILPATHQPVFLRDGNFAMIGVGIESRSVNIWDLTSGRAIRTWIRDNAALGALAVSSNMERLATSAQDDGGKVKLWNASNNELITIQAHSQRVHGLSFSPDNTILATSGMDGTVNLWNVENGSHLRQLGPVEQGVRYTRFSPDGNRIVFGKAHWTSETEQLYVWDIATGETLFALQAPGVRFLNAEFSPDGRWIATSAKSGSVTLWNASDGKLLATFSGIEGWINTLAFSSDGSLLAAGGERQVCVWETDTAEIKLVVNSPKECWHLAFDQEGDKLVTSLWSQSEGGETRIWNLRAGDPTNIPAHEGTVWSVAFSPDGHSIASASRDKTVKIWNSTTHKMIRRIPVDDGRFISFSPDGKSILSGGESGAIGFWDTDTGGPMRSFKGAKNYLHGGTVSPNGRFIAASGRENLVRIWDADRDELLHVLGGHTTSFYSTYSVAFSPDSKMLASAGADFSVRLWDVKNGRTLRVLSANGDLVSVVFDPNGKTVAAGSSDRNIYRWNVIDGEPLPTLRGGHDGTVWGLTLSPDGQRIASGDGSGLLVIWDFVTGNPLLKLDSQQSAIWGLAWSPDGKTIVSAGGDGRLRFWQGVDGAPSEPSTPGLADVLNLRMSQWTSQDGFIQARRIAGALAWIGRTNEHEAFCRRVLAQAASIQSAVDLERAAKAYLVRPGADPDLLDQAIVMAEKAWDLGQGSSNHSWFEMSLGLAQYRKGDLSATLKTLAQVSPTSESNVQGPCLLLQAMALHRLGQLEEARKQFKAAEPFMMPAPERGELVIPVMRDGNDTFFWLLHAEAEALIEGTPASR